MQSTIYRKIADTFEAVGMLDKVAAFLGSTDEIDRLAIAQTVGFAYYGRLTLEESTQVLGHLLSLGRDFDRLA